MPERNGFPRAMSLVTALAIAGCADTPTTPSDSLVTRTIQRQYDWADTTLPISLSVENRSSGSTFHLFACGGEDRAEVQVKEGGEWVNAGAAVCLAVQSIVAFELAPSSKVTASAVVTKPGTYRLRLGASRTRSDLEWTEYSNEFTVR